MAEYLKLYIRLGLKYPDEYIFAWADQTKGYWNGGYNYWIWNLNVAKNDLGIERKTICPFLKNLNEQYLSLFKGKNIFTLFVSIGFNTWLLILLLIYNILERKQQFILTIPILFITGTLLIATPVYSEFRYIYALFICLPFLIIINLKGEKEEKLLGKSE